MLSRHSRLPQLSLGSRDRFSLTLLAGGGLLTEPGPKNSNFYGTNDAGENSNMKTLFIGVLLTLAFGTQAFAIIRSPYPAKPMPPSHGHFILIGDDAKWQAAVKPPK
jgi:hypothetical protein